MLFCGASVPGLISEQQWIHQLLGQFLVFLFYFFEFFEHVCNPSNYSKAGAACPGSSASAAFRDVIETSSWASSGSFVVMFWSHRPGLVITDRISWAPLRADARMISYDAPAM